VKDEYRPFSKRVKLPVLAESCEKLARIMEEEHG